MINHRLRNTQGTKENQIKLLALLGFPVWELKSVTALMTLVLDAGNELHCGVMLNRLLNCIHKVKHRCVTSGLSA